MELSLYIVNVLAVGYVCVLPFVFFKKDGKWNILWLMTAAPYVAYEVLLTLAYTGRLETIAFAPDVALAAQVISTILATIGFGLIAATIASHRVPLALWHQNNDAPVNIVKNGPYSKVRHPFYTSFILILTGSFLAAPHWASLAITVYAYVTLTLTAKKEERKLSQSEFGDEYKTYMTETGRFFPKVF